MIKTEVTPNKNSTLIKVLIVAVFIIGGLVCAYKLGTQSFKVERVSNVFADVDGNGSLDLIVTGQVIFNADQSSNFLASQLSNQH